MGSKTIIFLGLLISAAYLYFSVTKYKAPHVESEVVKTEVAEQVTVEAEPEAVAKAEEATVVEEKNVQNANERISIPAFGFMSGDKNQIVALMSDNDENGLLAKHIEKLCKKKECSKDMRYEKDIIDAPWQKESVEIIELILDGSIENGSLFIEGNVLKLEGIVKDQKTEDTLKAILDATKSDTFKVENYTKLSSKATKSSNVKTKVTKEVVSQPKTKKGTTSSISKNLVKGSTGKTKSEVVVNHNVKKVKPDVKDLPMATVKTVTEPKKDVIATPVLDTTLDDESGIVVDHSIDEIMPATEKLPKSVMKTTKSSIKKRVIKEDVIATPVMETTLDAEARVRKILDEIKNSKPAVGVVAKPHMETTSE